jgi:L-aspartate oxidase
MRRDGSRQAEFVVVGSGVAGLRAAIGLAEALERVLLLTKDTPTDSNTDRAQGGVAVVLSDEDEVGLHFEDTLRAGAGLSEESAARTLVEDGARAILELIEWGAEFDRQGIQLAFGREAAHSARRVLHAGGDATGREIVRVLLAKASMFPSLRILSGCIAQDLWIESGSCRGVHYLDEAAGETRTAAAAGVLLATGGAGRVYRENTNPPQATGDGIAMAWLAGAELMDMEFVQFHPTALAVPGEPRWLLTEALRGEGGVLRTLSGRRFMPQYHGDGDLAPRDVVSRSIAQEIARSGDDHVLLDLGHLDAAFLRRRFPGIDALCTRCGLDFTRDPIPVLPAAHYFMGGVRTDLLGRSSVPGLYAAGETACTGVHGANRLASNSLLEGLVFGARVSTAMLVDLGRAAGEPGPPPDPEPFFAEDGAAAVAERVAVEASERLGVIRNGGGLDRARAVLEGFSAGCVASSASRDGIEARNRWIVARAVTEAATWRTESRGAHFRSDHPEVDDRNFRVHSVQRLGSGVAAVPAGEGPLPLSESE